MPVLGETKKGRDLGLSQPYHRYEWSACQDCGVERWIHHDIRKKTQQICWDCSKERKSGSSSVHWKGGRNNARGYIVIRIRPNDPFVSMAMTGKTRRILEHRYVMAEHLGRCLESWEIVHHKNHIRHDNRISNLQLVSGDRHKQITILENRVRQLEGRVTLLEAENVMLKKVGNIT